MIHFPSSLNSIGPNGLPRRSDSLNATQQKSSSNPVFLKIEEELHDARRVHTHGQEDDLRLALNMVINRVTEMSTLLSDAYKAQADLEVQLNVAKSNLQLVIANNEMLEDALRRDTPGQSKDIGWRRRSGRDGDSKDRDVSLERNNSFGSSRPGSATTSPTVPPITPASAAPNTPDNRFFKFRFSGSSSRPGTPSGLNHPTSNIQHLSSPSMPTLPSHFNKELEELTLELEKERTARKMISEEKTALEGELESLSQALFEEANKMVATERMKRAETEEELKELKLEQEALKSALRLIEGENRHLRTASTDVLQEVLSTKTDNPEISHSRSSSIVALKSRPSSPNSTPTITESDLPLPQLDEDLGHHDETERSFPPEAAPTPTPLDPASSTAPSLPYPPVPVEASPWADVSSNSPPSENASLFTAAAFSSLR